MATFLSGGKPIRLDLYQPASSGRHPAILLLHGSGGNVHFWADRIAPYLTQLDFALAVVHYFDRTGTTRADATTILDGVHYPLWLSTIAEALQYLRAQPGIDANRIVLLGVSLGGFLALSTAVAPRNGVRAVVDISGGLPKPYSSEVSSSFPPTLIVHGDQDNVVPVQEAHALDRMLTTFGVPHQVEILPGQGHWFDAGSQIRILGSIAHFLQREI
jgi:dienelactone hydrolase